MSRRSPALIVVTVALLIVAIALANFNSPTTDRASGRMALTTQTTLPREGDVRFKTTCNYSHTLKDDPIVNYGVSGGAAHIHDFSGNRTTNYASTTESLLAGATNCNDGGDHAAYWVPQVLVNGQPVCKPTNPCTVTAYYRRGGKGGTIEPYPLGLKIIAGWNMANLNAPTGATGWICDDTDRAAPRLQPMPASGDCMDLTMRIEFPDCIVSRTTLDSADHRSHMAYSSGGSRDRTIANVCPATHPVQVPELSLSIHYGFVRAGSTVALASPLPADKGVHADFFNAWDPARQQALVDGCLNYEENGVIVGRKCDSGGQDIP